MYKFLIMFFISINVNANNREIDNQALDEIYQTFMVKNIDVNKVTNHYHEDVIHVGEKDNSLLRGRNNFIAVNIEPFAKMIKQGQFEIALTAHVVRRVVKRNMANDVGYLHSKITLQDGKIMEQIQKYSWVFVNENNKWQVITDFDATPAPLSVLTDLNAQHVISL